MIMINLPIFIEKWTLKSDKMVKQRSQTIADKKSGGNAKNIQVYTLFFLYKIYGKYSNTHNANI